MERKKKRIKPTEEKKMNKKKEDKKQKKNTNTIHHEKYSKPTQHLRNYDTTHIKKKMYKNKEQKYNNKKHPRTPFTMNNIRSPNGI